jgi:hypothetical protein
MLAGMRGRSVCAVVAACLLAALGGCGGGGGSSSTTTGGTLSTSQLVAEGDGICKDAHDQFAQLQQNPPTTSEGAATLTQKLLDISQSELTRLRDLSPPAALKPALDKYLKALDENIAVLKQGLKAAQSGDATGYAAAQAKTVKQQVKRLQLAQAVGFKECSRPAGTASSAG